MSLKEIKREMLALRKATEDQRNGTAVLMMTRDVTRHEIEKEGRKEGERMGKEGRGRDRKKEKWFSSAG